MPTYRSIGSNLWEPAVPGTVNTRFQDWEAWVPTTSGSKIGKHRFHPRFQDLEASVPMFGNRQFLELGTCAQMASNSWGSQFFNTLEASGEVRKLAGLG